MPCISGKCKEIRAKLCKRGRPSRQTNQNGARLWMFYRRLAAAPTGRDPPSSHGVRAFDGAGCSSHGAALADRPSALVLGAASAGCSPHGAGPAVLPRGARFAKRPLGRPDGSRQNGNVADTPTNRNSHGEGHRAPPHGCYRPWLKLNQGMHRTRCRSPDPGKSSAAEWGTLHDSRFGPARGPTLNV